MPGSAHEVLLASIHDRPEILAALVTKLRGASLPPGFTPVDSNIRFVEPAEMRPDLLFTAEQGAWTILELQRKVDPDKRRRWLLAASVLLNQSGTLGDVLVITARRSVARWARRVAHVATALGTRLALTPVVFYLGTATVTRLIDERHPELAQFAAWAMHHRHGPKARAVVEQAIEVTSRLPAPLQEAQTRAIIGMLSDRMLAALKEETMALSKIPERPAVREFWLFVEARGMRSALFTLLEARGLAASDRERASIEACADVTQLRQWIGRAATAASTRAVLAAKSVPSSPTRPAPAPKPAARRKRASRAKATSA